MSERRTARAERVLERLDLPLDGGLPDVDVGTELVYATVPDDVDTAAARAALGTDRTTEPAGFPGAVYDVPTFGVTVLVFDAGVVACLDSSDRDVAGAAVTATLSKLAGAPVESSSVGLQTVRLTVGTDGQGGPASSADDVRAETGERDDGDDDRDRDEATSRAVDGGVTPSLCPGCGRVPDGWERYCPRCGEGLKPEACVGCGASLARWMLYCPECGTDATAAN